MIEYFWGIIRRLAEPTQQPGFSPGPRPCKKSPLPPFSKGGLGGISEMGSPDKISWQISSFLILTALATNHVPFEQSPKFRCPKHGASCKTFEGKRKSSFRASEARPGVQDFLAILDSGFLLNDGGTVFLREAPRVSEF